MTAAAGPEDINDVWKAPEVTRTEGRSRCARATYLAARNARTGVREDRLGTRRDTLAVCPIAATAFMAVTACMVHPTMRRASGDSPPTLNRRVVRVAENRGVAETGVQRQIFRSRT